MLEKALMIRGVALAVSFLAAAQQTSTKNRDELSSGSPSDRAIESNSIAMIAEGRRVFRFNTFGDESFWGDTLHLHQAIAGSQLGGVGPGVSPSTALAVGPKTAKCARICPPAGMVSKGARSVPTQSTSSAT